MLRESIQHVALRIRVKQKLLIVLSVDIRQVGRQFPEERGRHGPPSHKGARFAAGQDFPFDEQLALFHFQPERLQQTADRHIFPYIEDAGDARAGFSGADHVGRGASAEKQSEGIHHDGFAAAGFTRQEIQPGVEMNSQAIHHCVVFDHQLEQHARGDYSGAQNFDAETLRR